MKLDHIQLAMPESGEDEARGFFVGVLEMAEESKPPPLDQRGGSWFRKGDVILHVGVDKSFSPQTKAHPAFIVANIHQLESRLSGAGYAIAWDDALPDRTRFYTTDPFGNRIEFLQDGDGFSQK